MKASPQEIEELTDRFEGGLEFRDESEEAPSDGESVVFRSGPLVEKGNPTGYLDSADEELFDQWEDDEEEKFYRGLKKDDWRAIGQFCLFRFSAFLDEQIDEGFSDGSGNSRSGWE